MSMTGRPLARFLPYALAFFASLCIMTLELVAARLVARHVGASLHVWTSVIGVVLGGICLGNFLGGRLADRTEVRRIVGPLFAIGAALTLWTLWMNTIVGRTPGLEVMPWSLRTLVVVSLNFLVPATVLGLIGPVVAKVAVDQADRTGSAIGDVYFWGAVGSIVGTFLAGFVLIYEFPTSVIVTVVAAALLIPAVGMMGGKLGGLVALLATGCLGIGSVERIGAALPSLDVVATTVAPNPLVLVGHGLALVAGGLGVIRLLAARRPIPPSTTSEEPTTGESQTSHRPTRLADLAALAFLISLAFMSLEMVAGRMTTRHLGSSIYGWTSIIGVMLGGLSLGNLIGGKVADVVSSEKQASWLFLVASAMVLLILFLETPPAFLGPELAGSSLLTYVSSMDGVPWALRVLTVVAVMFFLPSITMGTVSPVVTKLAIDRLRKSNRTGTAIGSVYAWGMVGSILGTFLAGFLLIDLLGTKGVLLAISTAMALVATLLGGIGHATWAGIPLGLTFIALAPLPMLQRQGVAWGIRNVSGDPEAENGIAYLDESNYYYIKVESAVVPLSNSSEAEAEDSETTPTAVRRTLVLDNLIHGYFILGHPEHIEYDYEFIYAQVTRRIAEAKAARLGLDDPSQVPLRALFLGGGSYTFPRYLQHLYPNAHCDVAEIDPAVTRANHAALGLPENTTIETHWGDARQFVERFEGKEPYDLIFGDAFNDFSVPWHLTTREFNDRLAELLDPHGAYMINIIDVYRADQIAAERALEQAQIDAVAAVFHEAGNVQDSAEALSRAIRTSWRGEPLGSRFGLIGEAVQNALEGVDSRQRKEIEAALRDPIAGLETPFRGDVDQLAEVALDTLARAQAQRDQNATADALIAVLNQKKVDATVELLRRAGVTRQPEQVAEAIVEVWFGGTRTIVNLLEVINPDTDIDRLAQQIDSALQAVEADLKESPALLSHRLSIPAEQQREMTSAQRVEARQSDAISRKLRDLGVRRGSEDYANAVAKSLAERAIRGELDTLARQVAEAARAVGSDPTRMTRIAADGVTEARNLGAFLGAWTETAKLTFSDVEVFGTDTPGNGFRETFVVVASESPIDLSDLGDRPGDPKFEQSGEPFLPDPYGFEHRDALRIRSRGIILTDDYAPVDNLLAPVAATRGSE
ncbi:fused MFS/spermidine synthase [Tautonia marina]|uniref:fused MFS/spermidine synthase n=1 Tax=Tautonia marina TaxID=2653855 RepID=UPI001260F61E|nr:fused MFS/spermidine synthase [Tautonia marina]